MPRRRSYGFSFSWKRALGISAAKSRISRATGIPLTRQGRQRKLGRMAGCGCLLPTFSLTMSLLLIVLSLALVGCSAPAPKAPPANDIQSVANTPVDDQRDVGGSPEVTITLPPSETPTSTASPTATSTETPQITATDLPTVTPRPTATPDPTDTPTIEPTVIPAAASTTAPTAAPKCCRICKSGKACGDSCISKDSTCHKAPGCACNG